MSCMADLGGSFCGYPACQVWADFYLWERLLNDHPDLQGIVELGTAYGGFALYLKTQAEHRGLTFVTFDCIDHATAPQEQLFGRPAERPRAAPLTDVFMRADVLRDVSAVAPALRGRQVALLCDNGDKRREVALYTPLLMSGSLLIVHDWLEEIGPDDMPAGLVERYGEFCDEIGSMSRVFAC